MNRKDLGLSRDERNQLLVFIVFLFVIITLFLGTAFLLNRANPKLPSLIEIFGVSISPYMGIFLSLIFICVVLISSLLKAYLHNTLIFSHTPLLIICFLGLAGFFFSIYKSFTLLGFTHGIMLLVVFSLEGAAIAIGGIKLIDWLDSLYGIFPFSIRKGLSVRNVSKAMSEDSLLDDLIGKQK